VQPHRIRFGPFDFDPDTLELRKDTRPIRIQEQPARILAMLLAARGSLVTRDDLRERLWPPDTFVDFDNSLNTAVNKLRAALGDRAQAPRYVETVGRRGYRFIAPIEAPPLGPTGDLHARTPAVAIGAPPTHARAARLNIAGWIAAGLLLVSVFALALVPRRSGSEAPARLRSHVVTALRGAESSPTLSPDGTQVAYVWQGNLYVQPVNVRVGAEVRIAEHAAAPAWSPDGQWIAFRRPKTTESWSLMLVTPHGRDEHEIATLSPPPGLMGKHGFSWSPRSDQIASVGRLDPGRPPAVIALSLSTRNWTRVVEAAPGTGDPLFPAYAPDGLSIAYVRVISEQACQEVVIRDLTTGTEKVIATLRGGTPFDLGWLADGTALLVSIFQDEALTGLWRIPRDGGALTPVDPSERASGFGVAAKSQSVAYASWNTECDLWETSPAPGAEPGPSRRLPGSGRFDWDVQVSPDNSRLAFASLRTRMNQIWVCRRDGLNCSQLTRCASPCTTPRWSPDSTEIVYLQHDPGCGGQFTIHAIGLDGSRPRPLARGVTPTWSRDGKWVYFGTGRTGQRATWKVPSAGGSEVLVAEFGGGGRVVETEDGWLFFTHPSDRALYRMRPDGTDRELVSPKLPPLLWSLLRDSRIFFDRPGATYFFIDFTTGQRVDYLRLPPDTARCNGFDIAPDGAVVYSRSTSEGDIVLLDGVK
jgi:Tol biopolymer transport system component/DNA-binding winged helix-turn-helix (wHTH) protein